MAKTSQTLVERLMAELKIGEKIKFQNFFNGQLRDLESSISANNRSIENLQFKFEGDIKALDLQIEDAELAVQEAYKNITVEDIETNAKQKEFASKYWKGVTDAESLVKILNDQKEELSEKVEKSIKHYEEQNEKLQARIDVINGK